MEERMRFVLRLKDRESIALLCREFGISRVTGYKIYEVQRVRARKFNGSGANPYRYANRLPAQLEAMIVAIRQLGALASLGNSCYARKG